MPSSMRYPGDHGKIIDLFRLACLNHFGGLDQFNQVHIVGVSPCEAPASNGGLPFFDAACCALSVKRVTEDPAFADQFASVTQVLPVWRQLHSE